MQKKRAISLIVLVITIIVMVILAGAIILTLNNNGIINQASDAVEQTNLATVKEVAQLGWAEAYAQGARTNTELKLGVADAMTKNKIEVSKYNIVVTTSGVTVRLKAEMLEEWKGNVVDIVDTVPIPKGFVASPYKGENTKDGGLVIYELNPDETTIPVSETHYTSMTTRNQYVWVPVAKEEFVTKFVRQGFDNNTASWIVDENGNYYALGKSNKYWEVIVDESNMPLLKQTSKYMTSTTLAEVQEMYESVKEYEGFYIARYEAGVDTQRTEKGNAEDLPGIKEGTKVYSVMGKMPYTYIPWTWNGSMNEDTNGAVEVARRMYPKTNTNYGAVSTLTYGVQWDRTLAWWLEVGAKDGNGNVVSSVTDSTSYGNYSKHVINSQEDLNEGALVWDYTASKTGSYVEKNSSTLTYPKASGKSWVLSTGTLKVANINNIYDMAGNVQEWTMEGVDSSNHIFRGGSFNSTFGDKASGRSATYPPPQEYNGFRVSLYIKK